MGKYPWKDYRWFLAQIFEQLNPADRHILFYYSLFDPSSGEILRIPEAGQVKTSVLRTVRRYPRLWRTVGRKQEDFLSGFVYSGDFCCFTVAAALSERGIKTVPREGFPDLVIIKEGEEKTGIEIKRLVSCTNLEEYLTEEILTPLQEGRWKKDFGLLLLFPVLEKENPDRINALVEGLYALEGFVKVGGLRIRILCHCIQKGHQPNSPYSLEKLIDKLASWEIVA
jgi:hypothetical protein